MSNGLHDSVMGDGPDVVLLHGLFGQGTNMGALARALQANFRVHCVDLPDHGHSEWSKGDISIAAYAEQIADWMDARHMTRAHWVGHSLGGKVAMALALAAPAYVDRLVVADIAPVAYAPGHDRVFAGLAAVAQADCQSRQQAGAILEEYVDEPGVIQFLLMSLTRDHDGMFRWRLNHVGLAGAYDQLRAGIDYDRPFDGEVLLIRGELSDYVRPEHEAAMLTRFPHTEIATIEKAGHWLHAEKPSEFNELVGNFLL